MSASRTSIASLLLAAALVAGPRVAHAEPETAPATPAPGPRTSALRTVGLVEIGVGATFLVGGTLVALSGLQLKRRIDDECPGKVCPASAQSDLDSLRGRQTATNAFWLFGALVVGSGVAIVLSTGSSDAPGEKPRGQVSIAPAPGGVTGVVIWLPGDTLCTDIHDERRHGCTGCACASLAHRHPSS
jgi:hypothetical protein